jgi:hypothetical protein
MREQSCKDQLLSKEYAEKFFGPSKKYEQGFYAADSRNDQSRACRPGRDLRHSGRMF